MTRPTLPPTPASSTDIKAKENASFLTADATAFNLPPAAISVPGPSSFSAASWAGQSTSYRPPEQAEHGPNTALSTLSPIFLAEVEHRSSPPIKHEGPQNHGALPAQHEPNATSLPSPPSRSRKIIQVKPNKQARRSTAEPTATATAAESKTVTKSKICASATVAAAAAATPRGKKKEQGGATISGRKVARKTAHSLIERRRRSKMNEEFDVLKNMIPACDGQDMHKLTILQASIDYMQYLKNCLKSCRTFTPTEPGNHRSHIDGNSLHCLSDRREIAINQDAHAKPDESMSDDEESEESDTLRADRMDAKDSRIEPLASNIKHNQPFASAPSLRKCESPPRSFVREPTAQSSSTKLSHSFKAETSQPSLYLVGGDRRLQTSPVLSPHLSTSHSTSEVDHEASAALLMLNAFDRRERFKQEPTTKLAAQEETADRGRPKGRSISVKDLLRG